MGSIVVGLFLVFVFHAGPAAWGDNGDVEWEDLPTLLTEMCKPAYDVEVDYGEAEGGKEYALITPEDSDKLDFRITNPGEEVPSYRVVAQQAYYWPDLKIFRFEEDIKVTSQNCTLEGDSLDVLLGEETVRLVHPQVILIQGVDMPIVSNAVRLRGVGTDEQPLVHWDPGELRVKEKEQPPEPKSPGKTVHTIDITKAGKIEPGGTRVKTLHTLDITRDGKIELGGKDYDLEEFEERVQELASESTQDEFTIAQTPDVSANLVRRVHKTLDNAGFKNIKTKVLEKPLESLSLSPENEATSSGEDDARTLPAARGARLLWVAAPGRYILDGNAYNGGSLRQALRRLARTSARTPLVIAQSAERSSHDLDDLVADLRAFGFGDIQIAYPASR